MKKPWILIDANNLAFCSFYAMRGLEADGVGTAVAFGVFRTIMLLQHEFGRDRIAFCFDVGRPRRCILLPTYKSKRKDKSKKELKLIQKCRDQIDLLRTKYLPRIGFKNIFWQEGHEADDIIAAIVNRYPDRNHLIVSSDSDLYQLLASNVCIYSQSKHRVITRTAFEAEKGIDAAMWAQVKALAGCSSDDVPGIAGIGEKTAIQFLSGNLTSGAKFEAINKNNGRWRSNLGLVKLPYPKTKEPKLQKDGKLDWEKTLDKLHITSLGHLLDDTNDNQGIKI